MALDPSIFAQFLRPPKSMNDYDREEIDLESARQGQQSNALQLMMGRQKVDEYQRGVNESNALRELQRSLAGKPEADVVSGYRAAGRFGEAAKLESDMLDRQKKQKDIAKDAATTAKTYGEAQADALKRYRGALDFIDTPQGVARWLQAQYADPLLAQHMQALGPLDQALQRLPQDPAGLQQWRQQAAMGMEKYMEQQRLQAAQVETARHNASTEALTQRGQDVTNTTTRRGQDMADTRARELNATTKTEKAEARRADQIDRSVTQYSNTLQKEGIPELETAVSGLENVLGLYDKKGPDGKTVVGDAPGVGILAGALPGFALPEEGKNVRQAIAQVRNIVLSARSGAAVTDQELRRLVEELGTGVGQSEESLRTGLQRVRERLEAIKANAAAGVSDDVKDAYEGRGGIPIQRGAGSRPASAGLTRVPLTGARPPATPAPAGIKFLGFE